MGAMGHYSIYVALLQTSTDTCRWPRICWCTKTGSFELISCIHPLVYIHISIRVFFLYNVVRKMSLKNGSLSWHAGRWVPYRSFNWQTPLTGMAHVSIKKYSLHTCRTKTSFNARSKPHPQRHYQFQFYNLPNTVLFRIVRPRGGDRGQSGRNFRAGHVARGHGT